MENCQTIKIKSSLNDNNNLRYNFNNKIILNNNNKKKLDLSTESNSDQNLNNIEIKRKKLDNIKTDNLISSILINSKNININKNNKENNPPSNTIKLNPEIKQLKDINHQSQNINNTDMSTTTDNINTEPNTENIAVTIETVDITSESCSVLPTPPQTPKTSYCIPNESNNKAKAEEKSENENEPENESDTESKNNEELKEKAPVIFDYINVSVHDEINNKKSNVVDNSSEEDDDDNEDEDSDEEYEDINIGEEFEEINNSDDITSATNLLSVSNETISRPNSTMTTSSESDPIIPLNNNTFNNSNRNSLGNIVSQNTNSINYNDSTLNSGDSTLIQNSSVSSYIDKEDEEMSESSVYLKKFSIYTASASQPKNPRPSGTLPAICKEDCGEDAYFILDQPSFSALGIADGVGGWTFLGYDPSLFAWDLMNCCKECATTNSWPDPQDILVGGYNKVVEKNEIEAGSSTACILTLDKTTGTVYSSNIGDSGFIVIRNGKVVYQTHELQHYFNAPYQLSVLPDEMKNDPINIMDSPNDAIIDQYTVEEGDVIVLGTDGLWDNIFNEEIITKLASSIEKINDIQIQIKQINEKLYQYQLNQKRQQKEPNELKENTENLIQSNKNENKNKNQNNDEVTENKINEDKLKEEKVVEKVDNDVKNENKNENEIVEEEIKTNSDEVKEDNNSDNTDNEVKTEPNKIKDNEHNINKENKKFSLQDINELIKRKEELNNECNRILKEISVKLTLDTREMSRNFDKVSPFSYNAKKCGIIHYGGKFDDITVVVAYIAASEESKLE
ncbi:protein serine/threonine phosphatase 2C [Neocallimastix lanati (nom. inval.)]|nr:protein serine/threonine phosphatase 2C [Neocallimastix sp. JGI-2020a]